MKPTVAPHDDALERVLTAPALAADDALIALAERFAGCARAAVLEQLDDAARGLFGAAAAQPRVRAQMLADALTDGLALEPVTHEHEALLIDRALASRRAHPLVIASIGHELARRAGFTARICRVRSDWWIALPGEESLTAIGCSPGRPDVQGPLQALCPHQVAFSLVAHLGHYGPPAWHGPADRLMRRLPCGHHDDL